MKTGRRNLLKMLGLSPALLVPWTPQTEQPAPTPPPPAEPEKLTLEEAMQRVDWSEAMSRARFTSLSGVVGYSMPKHSHSLAGHTHDLTDYNHDFCRSDERG